MRRAFLYFVFLLTAQIGRAEVWTFPEDRGTLILLVDNTMASALVNEINTLKKDLLGDGWSKVIQIDVPRTTVEQPLRATTWPVDPAIHTVKNLIKNEYNKPGSKVGGLYILGHLPIPLTGSYAADGHGLIARPAPTDAFYADMNGAWTDTASNFGRVPGDGIFDYTAEYPGSNDIELEYGRVDLWNMPEFGLSETELLRRYLNKAHNYRHKIKAGRFAAIHKDQIPTWTYGKALEDLKRMFGANVIECASGDASCNASTRSQNDPVRMAFSGAGSTLVGFGIDEYKAGIPKVDIQWICGSYTWDWRENRQTINDYMYTYMRAALAGPEYGVGGFWGGKIQQAGIEYGYTFGKIAQLAARSNMSYAFAGDPTLRLHVMAPVSNVTINKDAKTISWTASPDAGLGYKVYRAITEFGPYTLLTANPITSTSFQDNGMTWDRDIYMVKAVALQRIDDRWEYRNSSQGVFKATVDIAPLPITATPVIGPSGGEFTDEVTVTMQCPTVGAQIRYTTDGAAPTSASTLYTSPIRIAESKTIRARAMRSGHVDSTVTEASFVIHYSPKPRDPFPAPDRGSPRPRPPFPGDGGVVYRPGGRPAMLQVQLATAEQVTATVYDRFGKEIRVIANNELPAGEQAIEWDGRDASGQLVSAGTYIVQINKSTPERLKIVVVK